MAGPDEREAAMNARRKLISIVLPTLGGGGVERVRIELARRFIEAGYAVEFVLLRRSGELLSQVPEGAEIVELGASSFRNALLPLRRHFRARRPDAILAAMWPLSGITLLAARLARSSARIVVSEHAHLSKSGDQGLASKTLLRLLGRQIYSRSDAIVSVSRGVGQDLAALIGVPETAIEVIHNPVRQTRSTAQIADVELAAWWNQSPHRLLTAGRLAAQKDQATLLHAFSLLRERADTRLIVLGEGPERPRLERFIGELGLEDYVRLPGFADDIRPYLAQASLFVLSSKWEGLGNVITEALVEGVPVVSTDCPSGPSELLDGGRYGALVPVEDPRSLAEAMFDALTKSHDRGALRDRGRRFDPGKVAADYLRLLDPDYRPAAPLLKR